MLHMDTDTNLMTWGKLEENFLAIKEIEEMRWRSLQQSDHRAKDRASWKEGVVAQCFPQYEQDK